MVVFYPFDAIFGRVDAEAHSLRSTRVWRSVNDSKINVINESQALGAQDSVRVTLIILQNWLILLMLLSTSLF